MSSDARGTHRESVKIHLGRGANSAIELRLGEAPPAAETPLGRVPRISRMLALARKIDGWVRSGTVRDLAEAARLGGVTRARMTQITNLLNLCPEIQAWVLQLPLVTSGCDPVGERDLREIASESDWVLQRAMFRERGLGTLPAMGAKGADKRGISRG
ncbi:MAG: hypothetical protein ACKVZJ_11765 [Phycisphaerales bacterium]